MKNILVATIISIFLTSTGSIGENRSNAGVTMKGKVFVTEKKLPIIGAQILLMPADKSPGGAETKTDENGDYKFENLAAGKYSVSIRSYYKRQEDVPCQFLLGKTKDVESTLTVLTEKGQIVLLVIIKNFSIKGNKDIAKDFDLTCKPIFGQ